jgi:hypothetical protein
MQFSQFRNFEKNKNCDHQPRFDQQQFIVELLQLNAERRSNGLLERDREMRERERDV